MNKVWIRALVALMVVIGFYWVYLNKYLAPYYIQHPNATKYNVPKSRIYRFPNLIGPEKKTVLSEEVSTSWKKYAKGSNSRLAVLLTDENSYWLDLVHGLKSAGIPFLITKNYREALKHQVVLVYPTIVGLPADMAQALASFPKKGGTLIAQGIILPPLVQTFGIKKADPIGEEKLARIHFDANFYPTKDLKLAEQKVINVGDQNTRTFVNAIYFGLDAPPLASYENDYAAVVQKNYNKGHAYAFGLDLGRYFSLGYSRRQWGGTNTISNEYVNHYEPHIDVLLQTLKAMYLENQPNGVTLSPVPDGKSLAVIFSFDNDSAEAVSSMNNYREILAKFHKKGTFFILTKYITDGDDFAFFKLSNLPLIKQLIEAGMEVSSEGVSHSMQFNEFPLGTGEEQYPDYQPYVMHTRDLSYDVILESIPKTVTYNGSILGELRVSRFLLKHFFPSLSLLSFRPGYLKNPHQLPQALEGTGFRYSSSTTTGDSLTHLPFQLNYNRGIDTLIEAETPVYEFPITLEDQKGAAINRRLPQALELAKKISSFRGLYVILIHPDPGSTKTEFLEGFIQQLPSQVAAWFGTVGEYGAWWVARDQVAVDVDSKDGYLVVSLQAPQKIKGLTLIIPEKAQYFSSQPTDLGVQHIDNLLIIQKPIYGKVTLKLKL